MRVRRWGRSVLTIAKRDQGEGLFLVNKKGIMMVMMVMMTMMIRRRRRTTSTSFRMFILMISLFSVIVAMVMAAQECF